MKRVVFFALFALVVCSAFGATYWVNIYGGQNGIATGTITLISHLNDGLSIPHDPLDLQFYENIPGGIAGKYYVTSDIAPCSGYSVEAICHCNSWGGDADSSSQIFTRVSTPPYQLPHCYLGPHLVPQPPQTN